MYSQNIFLNNSNSNIFDQVVFDPTTTTTTTTSTTTSNTTYKNDNNNPLSESHTALLALHTLQHELINQSFTSSSHSLNNTVSSSITTNEQRQQDQQPILSNNHYLNDSAVNHTSDTSTTTTSNNNSTSNANSTSNTNTITTANIHHSSSIIAPDLSPIINKRKKYVPILPRLPATSYAMNNNIHNHPLNHLLIPFISHHYQHHLNHLNHFLLNSSASTNSTLCSTHTNNTHTFNQHASQLLESIISAAAAAATTANANNNTTTTTHPIGTPTSTTMTSNITAIDDSNTLSSSNLASLSNSTENIGLQNDEHDVLAAYLQENHSLLLPFLLQSSSAASLMNELSKIINDPTLCSSTSNATLPTTSSTNNSSPNSNAHHHHNTHADKIIPHISSSPTSPTIDTLTSNMMICSDENNITTPTTSVSSSSSSPLLVNILETSEASSSTTLHSPVLRTSNDIHIHLPSSNDLNNTSSPSNNTKIIYLIYGRELINIQTQISIDKVHDLIEASKHHLQSKGYSISDTLCLFTTDQDDTNPLPESMIICEDVYQSNSSDNPWYLKETSLSALFENSLTVGNDLIIFPDSDFASLHHTNNNPSTPACSSSFLLKYTDSSTGRSRLDTQDCANGGHHGHLTCDDDHLLSLLNSDDTHSRNLNNPGSHDVHNTHSSFHDADILCDTSTSTLLEEDIKMKRQHICLYCGACFKRPTHLKRHLLKHTDLFFYECTVCYSRFKRKDSFDRHMKNKSCRLFMNSSNNGHKSNQGLGLNGIHHSNLLGSSHPPLNHTGIFVPLNAMMPITPGGHADHPFIPNTTTATSSSVAGTTGTAYTTNSSTEPSIASTNDTNNTFTGAPTITSDGHQQQPHAIHGLSDADVTAQGFLGMVHPPTPIPFGYGMMKKSWFGSQQPAKFICFICSRSFSKKDKFESHLESHQHKPNLKCQYCEKEFQVAHKLKRHELTHLENKKLYRCQVCLNEWTRIEALNKHYKNTECGHLYHQQQLEEHLLL